MNIFELAPKELTNSAVWAWILLSFNQPSGSNDPRRRIAEKIFMQLEIPVPEPADVHEIITEKSLRSLYRPGQSVDSMAGRDRMDIFFRTSGQNPSVLFIENKVADLDVLPLLNQMERYYNNLNNIAQVDSTYCSRIYPAYFGFEPDTAEALLELASSRKSVLNGNLLTFPAPKMLEAFEGTGFEVIPILKDFHGWLKTREQFINFRKAARKGENVSIDEVIEASIPLGFGKLLSAFVDGMEHCQVVNSQINKKRVDIRNHYCPVNFLHTAITA